MDIHGNACAQHRRRYKGYTVRTTTSTRLHVHTAGVGGAFTFCESQIEIIVYASFTITILVEVPKVKKIHG